MEAQENLGHRLTPYEKGVYDTITLLCADEAPYERTDEVSETIGTSPNIDGTFVVRSYRKTKDISEFDVDPYVPHESEFNVGYLEDISEFLPDYEDFDEDTETSFISRFYTPPPQIDKSKSFEDDPWHSSGQKLVIVPNEGEGELTLIDFSYDAENGSVDLYINKDVLKLIETNPSLFATDFVKHPILGEIFFEVAERDADETIFIKDEAMMWFLRASSNWPISEQMGITTFRYSIMNNDAICQVECKQDLQNGLEKVVTVEDSTSEDEPWASVFFVDKNDEVRVIRPANEDMAQTEMALLAMGMNRLIY